MFQVSERDAGKYTCRAENDAGTAESTADLVIKKKQLSPVFLKRLQSRTINAGQKLVLEVEVGGSPLPEVTWYLNENQIFDSAERQIIMEGTHCLLVIQVLKVNLTFIN